MRPAGGLCLSLSGHLLLALLLLAVPLLQPHERHLEPVIFVDLDRLPAIEKAARKPAAPPRPEPLRPPPATGNPAAAPEAARTPLPRPVPRPLEPGETIQPATPAAQRPAPTVPALPASPAVPVTVAPAPPVTVDRGSIPPETARTAPEDRVDLDQPAGSDYARLVRRRIMENLVYPAAARRRGQEGAVRLRFELDAGGRLLRSSVERESGVPALDRAAVEAIRKSAPFPAWTGSEPLPNRVFFITLRFRLN